MAGTKKIKEEQQAAEDPGTEREENASTREQTHLTLSLTTPLCFLENISSQRISDTVATSMDPGAKNAGYQTSATPSSQDTASPSTQRRTTIPLRQAQDIYAGNKSSHLNSADREARCTYCNQLGHTVLHCPELGHPENGEMEAMLRAAHCSSCGGLLEHVDGCSLKIW